MRKNLLFLNGLYCLTVILLPILSFAQNSYTVSNAPGTKANFRTLQGAHDSVPAGSILYVMPSANTYGDVVFTKRITVYGTGFFLGANLAPNTQVNTAPVIVNSIKFRPGSDNSFVEGLQLTDYSVNNPFTSRFYFDTVSNIVVSRCLMNPPNAGSYSCYIYPVNASNIIVRQCYMASASHGLSSVIGMGNVSTGFSGLQMNNNIIDFSTQGIDGFQMMTGLQSGVQANALFTNNTIVSNIWRSNYGNFDYTNNIFVSIITPTQGNYYPSNFQLGGTNIYNVVSIPDFFPSAGNNWVNANTDSMFIGTQAGYHSTDQKWTIRDGNAANTFGQGGTPAGAYGGTNPYRLSGIPAIPYIFAMDVPAQATSPGTIGIHIKAQATN